LACRQRFGIRQQLSGRGLADIRRDVVPFMVEADVLILVCRLSLLDEIM
jgi:hypothetical protein